MNTVGNVIAESFRFALSGGSVAILHILFVYLLTDVWGVWYLLSTVVSFTMAVIINFLLQKLFVRRNYDRASAKKQFLWYSLSSVVYLVLNTLSMYLFVEKWDVGYLLAQALIIGVLSSVTFFVNRTFIFK